ncbi:MAG: hypothetical protein ACRELV_04485 [Longimicrobiales bacterium]
MKSQSMMLILIAPLLLAACGRRGPDASETAEDDMSDMPGMGAMEDMEGMGGMQEGEGDMMTRMEAHMRMMQRMSGDSVQGMLSTHRQMAANMIAQMNREMRDMDMPADEAWNATVDSLRSDLVAMPAMSAAELEALMPAHHRRIMRLMEMHREMMSGMGT